MILDTETRSIVAQALAARDEETPAINRRRLEDWARRYPHDLVEIPPAIEPPKWPALLCSRAPISNVTKLPSKSRAR